MNLVISLVICECEKRAVAPGIQPSSSTLYYTPMTYGEKFFQTVENEFDMVVASATSPEVQKSNDFLASYSNPYEVVKHTDVLLEPFSPSVFQHWAEIQQRAFIESTTLSMLLGAWLVVIVFTCLVYLWTRAITSLYCVLYLIGFCVGWLMIVGLLEHSNSGFSSIYFSIPFYVGVLFNVLFCRHFWQLPTNKVVMRHIDNGFLGLILLAACVSFLLSSEAALLVLITSVGTWIAIGLLGSIVSWRSGFQPARMLVVGFLSLLGGYFSVLLGFQFPATFTLSSVLGFQVFGSLCLGWAIVDRIDLLKNQKTTSLNEAGYAKQEANDVLQKANKKLMASIKALEENEKIKDEFITMIGHELRTPLNAISVSLDQLSLTQTKQEQHDLKQYIHFGVDRLSNHIENVVMAAEISRQGITPHRKVFELQRLLNRLREASKSYLFNKNVDFDVRVDKSVSDFYKGDENLLFRLLAPIIDNACKYTDVGSVIVDVLSEKDRLVFKITDTGPGIDSEQKKKIFQCFVQGSTGYQRTHEGLGLGLSISQKLTRLLKGRIRAVNLEKEGTCFTVSIPIKSVEQKLPILNESGEGKGHALIVEDNHVNACVLKALIAKMGLSSDVVINGQEAVDAIEKQQYDVVLMDLQMPVMDGFLATKHIRGLGSQCPIIAVSANTDYQARVKCLDVGMNDFISKPVRKELLFDTVNRWLHV